MINISSAMGAQFAQAAQEFSQAITGLGPNPLRFSDGPVPDPSETVIANQSEE